MQIKIVNTDNRNEIRQFIQFPFDLYKDCACWVPPLVSDIVFLMNRKKHPFYKHSTAEFFIAVDNGKTAGRLAVLDNQKYNEHFKEKTAFLYFFDAINDIEVSQKLFESAFDWARKRGLNLIRGPLGFLSGDGIGALVEGFEHRPALGIPYNYSYYDNLFKKSGFSQKANYLSGYLSRHNYKLSQRLCNIVEKVKAKRGFRIKTFKNKKELLEWGPRIQEVYNKSFKDNFEYTPLSEEEASIVIKKFFAIADPKFIKVVMKKDEIIGFVFAFPDISEAIQKTHGRLWPFGWITLIREFKRTKWVNINGAGLIPEYRGLGANAILYSEIVKTIINSRFEHADIVQVEEQNKKSINDTNELGVEWYKKHRVYEKLL